MHYWIVRGFRRSWRICSVVVLEESPCPRGPVYKSLSLDHKDFAFCKHYVTSINSFTATEQRIRRRMSYLLMSDITCWLCQQVSHLAILHCNRSCLCPRAISPWIQHCGFVLTVSWGVKTSIVETMHSYSVVVVLNESDQFTSPCQYSVVLVLGPQVLSLSSSLCPCPQTLSPWQYHCQ